MALIKIQSLNNLPNMTKVGLFFNLSIEVSFLARKRKKIEHDNYLWDLSIPDDEIHITCTFGGVEHVAPSRLNTSQGNNI